MHQMLSVRFLYSSFHNFGTFKKIDIVIKWFTESLLSKCMNVVNARIIDRLLWDLCVIAQDQIDLGNIGGLRSEIFNIKLNFVITRSDRVAWIREMLTACKKSTLEIIVRERAEGRRRWWWISTRHYARIESWKSANRAAIIQTKPLTRFPPISCRNDPQSPKRSSLLSLTCFRHRKATMG